MSETTQSKKTVNKLNGKTDKTIDKTDKPWLWKKGESGNPNGRPLGTKNFTTDFDEAVEEIAKLNKITISEARKILLKRAYAEAKDGNFPYYKDIMDRYYGKAEEFIKADVTYTPIYGGLSRRNGDTPDIPTEEKNQSG